MSVCFVSTALSLGWSIVSYFVRRGSRFDSELASFVNRIGGGFSWRSAQGGCPRLLPSRRRSLLEAALGYVAVEGPCALHEGVEGALLELDSYSVR